MTLNKLLLIFGMIFSTNVNAQLSVNLGVDTTTEKSQIIIDFYNKYISDFREDNKVDYGDYFYENDIKSFYYPDKSAFGLIGSTSNYYLGEPHLLSLDIKSDTIKAKVMFATIDSLQSLTTNFIANYYFLIQENSCKFLVTQNIETKNWNQSKLRNVTFHYPPYHEFNSKRAKTLIDSIISLEKKWNLEPIQINYYFANTNSEIQRIKGFDFNFYMARSDYPSGLAYQKEKSVYCSGYGENYFHEIVHLYLNPLFPKSPMKEGIATFYGGSMGKSYQSELLKLHEFILIHPNINIADHSEFHYLDEQTIPKYVIQALICHLVFEKKGIDGLKKMMEINSLDEIYLSEFGITPDKQNKFLREQIARVCS